MPILHFSPLQSFKKSRQGFFGEVQGLRVVWDHFPIGCVRLRYFVCDSSFPSLLLHIFPSSLPIDIRRPKHPALLVISALSPWEFSLFFLQRCCLTHFFGSVDLPFPANFFIILIQRRKSNETFYHKFPRDGRHAGYKRVVCFGAAKSHLQALYWSRLIHFIWIGKFVKSTWMRGIAIPNFPQTVCPHPSTWHGITSTSTSRTWRTWSWERSLVCLCFVPSSWRKNSISAKRRSQLSAVWYSALTRRIY